MLWGVKEYELPSGKKVAFSYNEYGIIEISVQLMDMLMELIEAKELTNGSI